MKLKKMAFLILITGGILYGICTDLAYAGAAYIYEMGNSSDTGYAGAGLAGRANDAGTVFTNPAGMTRFKESKALVGVTGLYLYAPFNPDENTTVDGRDGDTTEIFGGANFAYIYPVSDSDTRPIDIPLGAMYRYGAGFKYRKSDKMTLGGGLSFLWEGDLEVKRSGNDQRGFVSGQYENVSLTFLSFYVQLE
jgi:long-subunit fatty acid transport protein